MCTVCAIEIGFLLYLQLLKLCFLCSSELNSFNTAAFLSI